MSSATLREVGQVEPAVTSAIPVEDPNPAVKAVTVTATRADADLLRRLLNTGLLSTNGLSRAYVPPDIATVLARLIEAIVKAAPDPPVTIDHARTFVTSLRRWGAIANRPGPDYDSNAAIVLPGLADIIERQLDGKA